MFKNSQDLASTNQLWQDNINRWRFYLNSYLGGKEYQDGEYLLKYVFENGETYSQRLANTPLDNHCKNIVHIYNSFLFKNPIVRDFGSITNDPSLQPFMEDADLEGRSFDAFMRDANIYASIFGHCWLVVDRPSTTVNTRAEELQQNIRPYVSLYSPENVLDWSWKREANGTYVLDMIKILESTDTGKNIYKVYTPETIETYQGVGYTGVNDDIELLDSMENPLGRVPAVILYGSRSPQRGIGNSSISDIADIQRAIYNELSEIEQLIRLQNHPSLVIADNGVDANAGAGAVITVPENTDPGLKPYMLQPNGQNLNAIMDSIKAKVDSIDRIAHMGGVRATATRSVSGVALQVEQQLLGAKLTEMADNLELCEENIFRLWAQWQGEVWNGFIDYPTAFSLRDTVVELQALKEATAVAGDDQALLTEIRSQAMEILQRNEE